MPWPSRNRSLAIKVINGVGRLLASSGGSLPRLTVHRLKAAAARRVGLSDYGDDDHSLGLEMLVSALNAEAHLTQIGRIVARRGSVCTGRRSSQ